MKRAPYLAKLSATQQRIGQDLLEDSFNKLRADVDPKHHKTFEEFIASIRFYDAQGPG